MPEIRFDIPKNGLQKNDAAILNIIAANKWKRPIYFTSPYNELGFGQYLRQDGLSYRLVPVPVRGVNQDWVMDKMINKFKFANADKPGVYFDEENRRHLNSIRYAYAQAAGNLADNGRKEDAKKLLEKCDKGFLQENFPYGMVSRGQQHNLYSYFFLEACYKAGATDLIEKITKALKKDLSQQSAYYRTLPEDKADVFGGERGEAATADQFQKMIDQLEKQYKNPAPAAMETPAAAAPISNKVPVRK